MRAVTASGRASLRTTLCRGRKSSALEKSSRSKTFDCRGKGYNNQGYANLKDGNGEFNDSISSMGC